MAATIRSTRNIPILILALAIVVLLGLVKEASAAGGSFGGGDGTTGNPYLVEDIDDLQNMSAHLSAHYRLANDIDASATADWNNEEGFEPIGDGGNKFTGSLDGQFFTIKGLVVNRTGNSDIGLFSYLGPGAEISNLSLEGGSIHGWSHVGGLAGNIEDSLISNVTNHGNVTGRSTLGGIVGYIALDSSIQNTINHGDVTGTGGSVGGILGECAGKGFISYVNNHGDVTGSGYSVGGIVGFINDLCPVQYATNHGDVTNDQWNVGGIVGLNMKSPILEVINHGDIFGPANNVGGIVGYTEGTTTKAINYGNVTNHGPLLGGIVGYNVGDITQAINYGMVSGWEDQVGGIVGINEGAALLDVINHGDVNSSEQHVGGIVGRDRAGSIQNAINHGQVESPWSDIGGIVGHAERTSIMRNLLNHGDVVGGSTVGGISGEIDDNCNIVNATNHGDVSGRGIAGGITAVSQGTSTIHGVVNHGDVSGGSSYSGVAGIAGENCHDCTVENATNHGNVYSTAWNHGGIVGLMWGGSLTKVYNFGDIVGEGNNVGGIVGHKDGLITKAENHGNVTSTNPYVGGIVGYNSIGDIMQAINYGAISSGSYSAGGIVGINGGSQLIQVVNHGTVNCSENDAGGIAGSNSGNIEFAYSLGMVTGTSSVGGLVGVNGGTVTETYSSGKVIGTGTDVGGLTGENTGTITGSFWDHETSGQLTSAGGTIKGTKDMMSFATFNDADWDFDDLWRIRPSHSYPFLFEIDRNLAPQSKDDHYEVIADGRAFILTPTLLDNDVDLDRYIYPALDPMLKTGHQLSVIDFHELSALGAAIHVHRDGGFVYDPTGTPVLMNLSLGDKQLDTFTYTVSDELGATSSATVTINVTGIRTEPVLKDTKLVEGLVERSYVFPLTAIDTDGDVLSWDMKTNATWLSLNQTTGLLTGQPPEAGNFWVLVIVSDGSGRSDQTNLTLTVQPAQDGKDSSNNGGTETEKVPTWAYASLGATLILMAAVIYLRPKNSS